MAKEGGIVLEDDWSLVQELFGYTCVYCDGPIQEQDHFVPIVLGGAHSITNVVPSCRSCNRKKRKMDPRSFINDEDRYEFIMTTMGDIEYAHQSQ